MHCSHPNRAGYPDLYHRAATYIDKIGLELTPTFIARRTFITLVGGAAVWPLTARAQQAEVPVAARSATREIPTVLIAGEPMQDGIVVSFNRPGRNATGVSLFTDVLSAERLALVLGEEFFQCYLAPGGWLAVIGRAASPSEKTARVNIFPQVREEVKRRGRN